MKYSANIILLMLLLTPGLGCGPTSVLVEHMSEQEVGFVNRNSKYWTNKAVMVSDTIYHPQAYEIQADSIVLLHDGEDSPLVRGVYPLSEVAYLESNNSNDGFFKGAAKGLVMGMLIGALLGLAIDQEGDAKPESDRIILFRSQSYGIIEGAAIGGSIGITAGSVKGAERKGQKKYIVTEIYQEKN